jgi:hypothetical protein
MDQSRTDAAGSAAIATPIFVSGHALDSSTTDASSWPSPP